MLPTVMCSAGLRLLLADWLTAVEGELAGAKLKLFTNDVDPGKAAVIGDFDLATFTGSAPIAVATWGEVFTDVQGNANALGSLCQWDYDSGAAETVYGVVLTNAGDALIGYSRLAQSKLMNDTSDSLAIVPKISCSDAGFGVGVRVA